MTKLTPIYISAVMFLYKTYKAGATFDLFDGAEAYTWGLITILQIIILIVYELIRSLRSHLKK